MKRQILTILVLLLIIIFKVQADNHFDGGQNAGDINNASTGDSVSLTVPVQVSLKDSGMDPSALARIDAIVNEGIRTRVFPGCQVLVLKEGMPVYDKCFGNYTYDSRQKVQPTTMYDLASLSKTTGTLLAVMKLYDEGKLQLSDKASTYLGFLKGTDKENITIKELLLHESGLPAYLDIYWLAVEKKTPPVMVASAETPAPVVNNDVYGITGTTWHYKNDLVSKVASVEYPYQVSDNIYVNGRFHDAALKKIAETKLSAKSYCYSCLNFILLKEIVENISGFTMDAFLDREFYSPMKLNNIAYLPLRTHQKEQIAPTLRKDVLRQGALQGYVHDLDAAFFGGVSGNAGLFATASDVASVYQMILNNGELDGKRYLSPETCKLFTTTTSASGRRALGFDKPTVSTHKSTGIDRTPKAVYGHTGYTGTCCWVDPLNKLVYVFLSNRTYPDDGVNKLAKLGIRTKIQQVIYQSIKNKS